MIPPKIATLLAQAPLLNDLGPGKVAESMRDKLESLDLAAAFAPHKIIDKTMAQACLAGLWLRFDFLDESHTISQSIHTPTGSFWHGIMHRREPDYDNAKYWFRRVGDHPVLEPLHNAASDLVKSASQKSPELEFLTTQSHWDPYRFVDLVAKSRSQAKIAELCQKIQLLEWHLLFDFCCKAAT